MDDAGGGRRGSRPSASSELLAFIEANWGLRWTADPVDLGGSVNLNVLVESGRQRFVGRVYRSHVTPQRLESIQVISRHLAASGLPFAAPVSTLAGLGWADFGGQLVEVEPFVATDGRMNDLDRLRCALPLLGQIHSTIRHAPELSVPDPVFANHLSAKLAAGATANGTARIRSWDTTPAEERLASEADALAAQLSELSQECRDLPLQLVHGDYWDNNVLFVGDEIALVTDLDFLGCRPRVDDLALTLYFTSQDIVDVTSVPGLLRDLVGLYESGLDEPLSEGELLALPLALARQPLWSIGVWVAGLDDELAARAHLAGTADGLRWGAAVAEAHESIQDELLAGA